MEYHSSTSTTEVEKKSDSKFIACSSLCISKELFFVIKEKEEKERKKNKRVREAKSSSCCNGLNFD